MKHPNEATLALHAGGDLGFLARWRTGRHLANCERCRREVAAFEGMREILPDLAEIPELPWARLAAEMKANIRLGLAAGECVRTGTEQLQPMPLFAGARAAVALASVVILVCTGVVLEHPAPRVAEDRTVVQTTADGIEVGGGGRAFRLISGGAQNVMFSAGAQGSLRARYVDPQTGLVTINNVDAE